MDLQGKRVVITRSADQAQETARMVEKANGVPVLFSTIEIVPPEDWGPVDEAIRGLSDYQWVIFTSVNGVRFFARRMEELGVSPARLGENKLCAIGPATAKALRELGLKIELVPERFVAESVLDALKKQGELKGKKILLPRAEIARNTLPNGLRAAGADVDVVTVYRTVQANPSEESKDEVRQAEVITFTSPSTLMNFFGIMGDEAASLLSTKLVACIGPVTLAKAKELGVRVDVVPQEYTLEALLRAVGERLG